MKNLLAAVLFFSAASAEAAPRHLLLFGGGDYAPSAMKRLAEWSGAEKGRILFIPWASIDPQGYADEFKEAFGKNLPAFDIAPSTGAMETQKTEFFTQLEKATAVFFCGGDQNRIMEFLKRSPDVRAALHKRYQDGVLFAGTSAGTAAMSKVMLTGEGDPYTIDADKVGIDEGLGLLPEVILDQHFLARQRENRLFSAVLLYPKLLGLGVDSEAALAVSDEATAEVVGPGLVMAVKNEGGARFSVELLKLGQRYDLKALKRLD